MATFYGRIQGNSGEATRTGSKDSHIFASLQSYKGSLQAELFYNDEGELCAQLYTASDSAKYGETIFRGSLERLKKTCLAEMKEGRFVCA